MRLSVALIVLFVALEPAFAGAKNVPLGEVADHALRQSQLTLPGSRPFHLKATITESTNPDSDYKAEVEEYWVTPEKWKRTIQSPDFSQTIVVNGDKVFEQNSGDYYPWWLQNLVRAIFDPLPMLPAIKQLNARIPESGGSPSSETCARFESKAGVSPTQASEFSVFCFAGKAGLLQSVVTPGYEAEFKDIRPFHEKQVARRIVTNPEPGTTIEANITVLDELANPDDTLFAIAQPTPPSGRLKSIPVDEAMVQRLALNTPAIQWPSVRDGKTSGVLSMFVSIDRNGHVREAWPLNSDNARLDDSAREQVMHWQFKHAAVQGVPVQLEAILVFAFQATTADPIPVLSDAEARKLATNTVDPVVPTDIAPRGSTYSIRITVSPDGKLQGVQQIGKPLSSPLFLAAYQAVRQWHFRPYLRNGKPDSFHADITFHVR